MHYRIPGSSFIFLMTSYTIYALFYYYITFFIQCYMNILEFHSIFYTQLLIPVILLTSTVDVSVCWLESNLGHLFCDANTIPLCFRCLRRWNFGESKTITLTRTNLNGYNIWTLSLKTYIYWYYRKYNIMSSIIFI